MWLATAMTSWSENLTLLLVEEKSLTVASFAREQEECSIDREREILGDVLYDSLVCFFFYCIQK
jgi:hypothetical protein